MPCTPIAESASRTSSSLNGLMIAVTSFMLFSRPLRRSELIRHEGDEPVLGPVLAIDRVERAFRVGALVVSPGVDAVAEVVRGPGLPHRVREVAVAEPARLRALVALVRERARER